MWKIFGVTYKNCSLEYDWLTWSVGVAFNIYFLIKIIFKYFIINQVRVIPLQLQKLFAKLLLLDQDSVNTTDLTDSFGWSGNEVSRPIIICLLSANQNDDTF